MSNQKIGVAIFAGLLVVTGIVSSGRFFDANALLDQFMDRASNETEMAALPESVELTPETGADAAPAAADPKPIQDEGAQSETPASAAQEDVTEQSAEDSVTQETEEPAENAANTPSNKPMEAAGEADTTVEAETTGDAETEIASVEAPPADPPVFDLLRVEPNGDMVVAGVSSPGAEMELVAGSETLTKTTANDNGEFVAVLDEALNPGDYEIVLRATDPNGVVMTSTETAIVSIPEAGSDEVIALVEAPGEPSRLITVPAAEPNIASEAQQESVEPETAQTEPPSSTESSEEAPMEVAKVEPESGSAAEISVADAGSEKRIRIEAVEIDGPTIFVAGAAEPGTRLRIYANEILLGDTLASAQGRFLIEVNRDLPVGDYIIRADALSANGAEVVMRAAVPFTRSAGEKLAAIAVPPTTVLPSEPPKIAQEAASDSTAKAADSMSKDAEEPTVVASAPAALQSGEQGGGVGELEQPLTPVGNSVVIRRGDTLWHISKRVYGQGIKYTTIYKANSEQIRDPDMIWPGQVFALPDETAASNN